MWFVYIIESQSKKLYTGITTNLERRFKEHSNEGSSKGAKFFRGNRPLRILYNEPHPDRSTASKREIEIKKMKRIDKIKLIKGNNSWNKIIGENVASVKKN